MLQWIPTVPPVDLLVSRCSASENRYSNLSPDKLAVCFLQCTCRRVIRRYLHSAGWTGGRMTFLKKKIGIYFWQIEKNNIKIKKFPNPITLLGLPAFGLFRLILSWKTTESHIIYFSKTRKVIHLSMLDICANCFYPSDFLPLSSACTIVRSPPLPWVLLGECRCPWSRCLLRATPQQLLLGSRPHLSCCAQFPPPHAAIDGEEAASIF